MVSHVRHSTGFTLLELILAVFISVMVLLMAIPSVTGAIAQRRLDESVTRFDDLVREAQKRAVLDAKAYEIVFEEDKVTLKPVGEDQTVRTLAYGKKGAGNVSLKLPFAVEGGNAWTFWSSGNCEPANVIYEGEEGTWEAYFDPLTTRGDILFSRTK